MNLPTLLVIASVCTVLAGTAHAHDLTTLPLGDDLKSEGPKIGHIWPCRIDPGAGGAEVAGPWIKADGTFDKTAKPIVPGDMHWPQRLTMKIEDGVRVFTFNALPNHGTGEFPIAEGTQAFRYDRNPNLIIEQDFKVSFPANPVVLAEPTCAPGAIGVLLSGTVLFSGLDAPGRDALAHEIQDQCDGHPQPSGIYHYHSLSACAEGKSAKDAHSPLAGYAIDGFGIFGRHGEGGTALSNADLDTCHGHTHGIEWDGAVVNMYHYHATDEFPYVVGCLRGAHSRRVVETLSGPPPG